MTDELREKIKQEILTIIKDEGMGQVTLTLSLLEEKDKKLAVKKSAFYEWLKQDKKYKRKFEKARAEGQHNAEDELKEFAIVSLRNLLIKNHPIVTIFTLKNLYKDKFGEGLNNVNVDNRQIIYNNPKALETVLKSAAIVLSKLPSGKK